MQSLSSPAAGEISHGKQTDLYGFRGPRDGVLPSSSESDLVGNEKAWCCGINCETCSQFRECTRICGAVFRLVRVSVTSLR